MAPCCGAFGAAGGPSASRTWAGAAATVGARTRACASGAGVGRGAIGDEMAGGEAAAPSYLGL